MACPHPPVPGLVHCMYHRPETIERMRRAGRKGGAAGAVIRRQLRDERIATAAKLKDLGLDLSRPEDCKKALAHALAILVEDAPGAAVRAAQIYRAIELGLELINATLPPAKK